MPTTQRRRSTLPLVATGAALAAMAIVNRVRSRRAIAANPPLGKFLDVGGTRLHYVERGSGPPILLVHGNGVMLEDWIVSGLLDELAKTHRVIAVDRPGYGHSPRPRGTVWTPRRQGDLMAQTLRLLEAEGAIVVGHSYGTLVATALAQAHPELLGGVVLMGGYFFPNARADVLLMVPAALPGIGDVVRQTVMPLAGAAMQPLLNAALFGPAPVTQAWRDDFAMEMVLRPSRLRGGAADAVHMVPAAADLATRHDEMTMPLTIIAGRGDRIVSHAGQSERLHAALPHSRLVLIDGVGHMVHHSATDRVAEAIRAMSGVSAQEADVPAAGIVVTDVGEDGRHLPVRDPEPARKGSAVLVD